LSAADHAAVAVGGSPPDGYVEKICILLYNPLPMPSRT
jgi:hypothetical protein